LLPLALMSGGGTCAARARAKGSQPIIWAFWREEPRRAAFYRNFGRTLRFLGQWLALAFLLESLMLNGYAALPLVSGLMEQGLQPGAALAFLVAGGVTSIPAAMALRPVGPVGRLPFLCRACRVRGSIKGRAA